MRESFWVQNPQKGFMVGAARSTVWKRKKGSYTAMGSNLVLCVPVLFPSHGIVSRKTTL